MTESIPVALSSNVYPVGGAGSCRSHLDRHRRGRTECPDDDGPGKVIADFAHFRSIPDNPNCISHDIVYSLLTDLSDNLWIGTIAGMDKLDLKKKKFSHYKKTEDPASLNLLDNVIASIYRG